MSSPSITVNTYSDSPTGHTNVTFRDANGSHLGTYGSNIKMGSSALPGSLGGVFAEDPGRQPSYTHKLLLPEYLFNKALYFAKEMASKTAAHVGDYSPFLSNCYDFVDDVLEHAGLPEHSAKDYVEPGSIVHSYGVVKDLILNPAKSYHWSNINADPSYGLPLEQYQIGHTIGFMQFHDKAFDTPEGVVIKSTLNWVQYESSFSPIVLDLENDGFNIIPVAESAASFDFYNNGSRIKSSWIGSDDGFLVNDRNENGKIDNLSEMFGHKDVGIAFKQLKQHDDNNDGVINIQDNSFSYLQIWKDANDDGRTQEGELFSLADVGVDSLSLDSSLVNAPVGDSFITERSHATVNGTVVEMSDIHFRLGGLAAPEEASVDEDASAYDAMPFEYHMSSPAYVSELHTLHIA